MTHKISVYSTLTFKLTELIMDCNSFKDTGEDNLCLNKTLREGTHMLVQIDAHKHYNKRLICV